jgi:adenylosuccinate synthase
MRDGKNLLFEGAQGTMLDIDHGTFPFVTSSSSSAGGACTGSGVPPTKIDAVIGISKTYTTRVGGGPFPTEALGAAGDEIRNRGHEFGSVTGRPRRCGWFDTKLDVLDELDEIPVCVAYSIDGKVTMEMPATVRELAKAKPIYETLPGWKSSTVGISDWDQLPDAAKRYVEFLEAKTGVEAGCVSTGPERTQTVVRSGSKFERITG